jgi:hypothetical protein
MIENFDRFVTSPIANTEIARYQDGIFYVDREDSYAEQDLCFKRYEIFCNILRKSENTNSEEHQKLFGELPQYQGMLMKSSIEFLSGKQLTAFF